MFKKCSFCGKRETTLNPLLSSVLDGGEDISICKVCVTSAADMINEDNIPSQGIAKNKKEVKTIEELLSELKKPTQIHDELDEYVIGQDRAKIVLSTAIYNHYKRFILKDTEDITIDKTNIMMIGPSGSGKTYISKKLAEIIDVPIVISDATSLTQTGYIGNDVESMLTQLFIESGNDIEKAQKGIIFIDEIDKIARKPEKDGKDSTGEGVQQNLLKIIEGTKVQVQPSFVKNPHDQKMVEFDTSNVLFIMSGVFDGLIDIIKERNDDKTISFDNDRHTKISKENQDWLEELTTTDLVEFGFLQEFLGRVPVQVTLDELTKDDLVHVLTDTKNSLVTQYTKMFDVDSVKLEFDVEAINGIAEQAIDAKVGARGLKRIIEKILTPHMYNIDKVKNIKINKEVVIKSKELKGKDLPKLVMKGN
jgi:ATP-dependent Clp protease ATP-binding subunit ClpX